MSNNENRNGKKWSINEILQLQREFELLELNIYQISKLHKRSEEAIVYKLLAEGFKNSLQVNREKERIVKRPERRCMNLRSGSCK
jgi:hypothetical protein